MPSGALLAHLAESLGALNRRPTCKAYLKRKREEIMAKKKLAKSTSKKAPVKEATAKKATAKKAPAKKKTAPKKKDD